MTATLSPRPLTEELEPARAGWITEWRPEDDDFWATTGRRVARRNLIFSIFAEHLGFSVWVLWSVLVVVLGTHPNDFPFLNPKVTANADKIFWLVALPNLIGALMRLPYTVAVLRFGGRNWTVVSALLLMIPIALATYCVTHPGTPYWFFLLTAATAGFGGGNFASSMTNIAFFYPERLKGTALGLNAAGGNIGLSSMQFVVPLLIFYNAAMVAAPLFWLPLVLAAAGGVPRSAGRLAGATHRGLAVGQGRRGEGDGRRLRLDGGGDRRRDPGRGRQEPVAVPDHDARALHARRLRQRLDVQDDPGDLQAPGDAGRAGRHRRVHQGRPAGLDHAGHGRCDRGAGRVLHAARDRKLDQSDGRDHPGVHHLLRDVRGVPARHRAVLPTPRRPAPGRLSR